MNFCSMFSLKKLKYYFFVTYQVTVMISPISSWVLTFGMIYIIWEGLFETFVNTRMWCLKLTPQFFSAKLLPIWFAGPVFLEHNFVRISSNQWLRPGVLGILMYLLFLFVWKQMEHAELHLPLAFAHLYSIVRQLPEWHFPDVHVLYGHIPYRQFPDRAFPRPDISPTIN